MNALLGQAKTFVQRLLWTERCHRADPQQFERLFQSVMERRSGSRFIKTTPHGSLGDRKTDGFDTETRTVYQVYSPHTMELAKTVRKIREDLQGAVEFWNDRMRAWTFVYNARGRHPKPGIPTDVASVLVDEAARYAHLRLDLLSDDDLWRIVRDELSPADRAEVLGDQYPAAWGGYLPGDRISEEELKEISATRIVIVHDTIRRIDMAAIHRALEPTRPLGRPIPLRPDIAQLGWQGAAEQQAHIVRHIIENVGDHIARFAVFGISEIPLLVHLGYVLSDITDVELFQYHRDERTWRWSAGSGEPTEFLVSGLPADPLHSECDVVIRVSLSARVRPEQSRAVVGKDCVEIDLEIGRPRRTWLRRRGQLLALGRRFRELLDQVEETVPRCQRIHLFYAGPAPGALAIGQTINPRMAPPVELYEFNRSRQPQYESTVVLDHDAALA